MRDLQLECKFMLDGNKLLAALKDLESCRRWLKRRIEQLMHALSLKKKTRLSASYPQVSTCPKYQ
jgi:hypothetical protein